jgi:hypothetical protein
LHYLAIRSKQRPVPGSFHKTRFSFRLPALLFRVAGDLFHRRPVSFHRSTPWNIASAAAAAWHGAATAAILRCISMTCGPLPARWRALPPAAGHPPPGPEDSPWPASGPTIDVSAGTTLDPPLPAADVVIGL